MRSEKRTGKWDNWRTSVWWFPFNHNYSEYMIIECFNEIKKNKMRFWELHFLPKLVFSVFPSRHLRTPFFYIINIRSTPPPISPQYSMRSEHCLAVKIYIYLFTTRFKGHSPLSLCDSNLFSRIWVAQSFYSTASANIYTDGVDVLLLSIKPSIIAQKSPPLTLTLTPLSLSHLYIIPSPHQNPADLPFPLTICG